MKNHTSHHSHDSHSLLAATVDATEEKVIEARNRLSAVMDAATETCAGLQKKAVAGAKATDKAIRGNPYQAMGVAFGIGALVGFLLSRRNRD